MEKVGQTFLFGVRWPVTAFARGGTAPHAGRPRGDPARRRSRAPDSIETWPRQVAADQSGDRSPHSKKRHVSTLNLSKRIFNLSVLLSLFLLSSAVNSQETKKPLSREQLISAAREIMQTARYCALITRDAAGRSQTRSLDPFPPDENMVIWLGTNSRTRKVAEIRRRPRVTLYYFDRDAQAYVTILGLAQLINDPKEKTKHWKDEWKDFYPDRDKDYLLIKVTPEKLEVVSVKKGIVGDPKTWQPPSVSFRSR